MVPSSRVSLGLLRSGVARDTVATLALNTTAVLLGLVLALVLSRLLGAAGYGAYSYAFAWAGLLSVPAVLGLTPVLVRNVAAYKAQERWAELRGIVRRSNQVVLAMSIVLIAVAAALELLLVQSDPTVQQPFLIGLTLVPLLALSTIRLSTLQALGHVVLARLPETIVAPAVFLASVVAAESLIGGSFSPSWAIGLQAAATLLAFGLGVILLLRRMPEQATIAVPQFHTRAWARSATPLLLVSGLSAVNLYVGVIALGATSDAAEVGVYGVASRIAVLTSFLAVAAMYALMPRTARLHATGEFEQLRRLLPRSARLVLLASSPAAVAFFLFPGAFLGLFGAEFATGGETVLRILVVGEFLKLVLGYGAMVLMMTGIERQVLKGAALGAAASVVLVAALVPTYGAEGAAIALAVSGVLANLSFAYFAWTRATVYTPAIALPRLIR